MATPETGLPRSIGAPATRALTAAGYTELSQLADVPAADLAKLHGVGPKALRLLRGGAPVARQVPGLRPAVTRPQTGRLAW